MTFSPHMRISFGGTLTSATESDEIWNCNINAVPFAGGVFSQDDTDTYVGEVQGALSAWFSGADGACTSAARLFFLKANWINAAGRYAYGGTSRHDYASGPGGGGGTSKVPNILSVATSWSSARGRGPGAHGRIYLPNATVGTAGSMNLTPGDRTIIATAGRKLLVLLANAVGVKSVYPVIASNRDASLTHITGVRVGSVYDVQRRRKSAAVETYTSLTYP